MSTEIRVKDLVVLIPGILGSRLFKDGKPVWSLSGSALARGMSSFGASIAELRLPADVGDDGAPDNVEPRGLMPGLVVLPGVGPLGRGYGKLTRWLVNSFGMIPVPPKGTGVGNLLLFSYDWRLSNRYNAHRLQREVENALQVWRAESGNPNAKVVLLCHSMGGLVARYYLEVLGGADDARALFTIGTPHRGSIDALMKIVNGSRFGVGPFKLDLTELSRSMPSMYQLLPTYRCVQGREGLMHVMDAGLDIEAERTLDGLNFHREMGGIDTWSRQCDFRPVVGVRQSTFVSVKHQGGLLLGSHELDGATEYGDGTVPALSAVPESVSPRDARQIFRSEQHSSLHMNAAVLDHVWQYLAARDRPFRGERGRGVGHLSLPAPEVTERGVPTRVLVSVDEAADRSPKLVVRTEGSSDERSVELVSLDETTWSGLVMVPETAAVTVTARAGSAGARDEVTTGMLVVDAGV